MKAKKPVSEAVKREIEVRAYLIWESEGRPHGREHEHWHRAEAEVLGAVPEKPEIQAKPEKKAPRAKAETKSSANGAAKAVVAAKAKKPVAKAKPSKPAHS